jgi:hypothetical protein
MGFRTAALCTVLCLHFGVGTALGQSVRVPGDYSTIQAAINAVLSGSLPDGTLIEVQPGTYNEALLIPGTNRSLTLRGVAGAPSTVVTAVGKGVSALGIFQAVGAIRIEGLSFRGGTGGIARGGGFTFEDTSPVLTNVVFESNFAPSAGGGVLSRSNAQFSHCQIRSNTAQQFGGGLVIAQGSRPTFSNCQIVNNISGTGGPGIGSIGSGGGVHTNDASPTFRGCVISGNQSNFAGGGIFHMGVFDSPYGPSRLVVEDTEISNNVTSRFSPADNPAEGGGIHIEDNAVAYLIRARILSNSANTGGGLNAYRARYEITSSIIEGNHAPDPLGVGGLGGGIGMTSNNPASPVRQASTLYMVDSVIRNNDARGGAGILVGGDRSPAAVRATIQIVDSLIDGNASSMNSGALRADRTDVSISNSQILKNTVAASGQSYGGGILLALGSTALIHGTTIARNAAVDFGGGLFIEEGSFINMSQSQVYRNTAGSGGGLYVGSFGPPSGTIQGSTIADNNNYQIHEQACAPLQATILSYQNNVVTPRSGQSDLYFSTCGGARTLAQFNAAPTGRTSGNTSAVPNFISFLATPEVAPTTLSWVAARASSVTISGFSQPFAGDTGSTIAAPAAPATYALTAAGPAGSASASVVVTDQWGAPGDTPVSGDFDGDGRADLGVYRGSTGQWFIAQSSAGVLQQSWGAPSLGDLPVPGDYDGDGKTDIAVFRLANGQWYILRSSGGSLPAIAWGSPALGDMPVAADFDGDNRADIAVYRQSSGEWFIRLSGGGIRQMQWGAPSLGDMPVARDYDGDGRADVGVYRPTSGQWLIARSMAGPVSINWGAPSLGDTPVPADYDGDGKADIAIARQQTGDWIILRSTGGSTISNWGFGDTRVPADYDGNGRAEIGIWQSSVGAWLIRP